MFPKLFGEKKDLKSHVVYVLPKSDVDEVYRECVTHEDLLRTHDEDEREQRRQTGRNSIGLCFPAISYLSGLLFIFFVIFSIHYTTSFITDADIPVRIIFPSSNSRTITDRIHRKNGTIEEEDLHYVVLSFPVDFIILKSNPSELMLRHVVVRAYRNGALVGETVHLSNRVLEDHIVEKKAHAIVSLIDNAADVCESDVPSFVNVDVYVTVEVGGDGEHTEFWSGKRKVMVCCTAKCNGETGTTKYIY